MVITHIMIIVYLINDNLLIFFTQPLLFKRFANTKTPLRQLVQISGRLLYSNINRFKIISGGLKTWQLHLPLIAVIDWLTLYNIQNNFLAVL